MLGVTAFDIVIGNPPYIQLQKKGGLLAKRYELSKADKKKGRTGFKSFAAQGDIYCLFYERGLELLSEEGILCYITSNSGCVLDMERHCVSSSWSRVPR